MNDPTISRLEKEIAALENTLAEKKYQLEQAQAAAFRYTPPLKFSAVLTGENSLPEINNQSHPETKIALFRSLFRGREDLYAKRFESKKTGKSGYQPVCKNEWVTGVCEKPRTSCGKCTRRDFEPVSNAVIRNHLAGFIPAQSDWPPPQPFVMGVYPLLQDETCHFLAVDFDKQSWLEVAALWIIAQRKVNTIILVHRRQLMDQWAERINQFLGIPKKDSGCFSGGKKKLTGVIDIAVMQSLVKKDTVEEWIQDYGQIIVDECHHISAASFERIIRKCPAHYRLGLSATLVRRDGQHPLVLMNLGDVRYSSSRHSDAPLFSQKVIPCFTELTLPRSETEPAIHDIFHLLVNDETRNIQISRDILAAHSAGREALVLSERIEHLDLLAEILKDKVPHLFILKGGMGKK